MKIRLAFCAKDLIDSSTFSFETNGILINGEVNELKFQEPDGTINVIKYCPHYVLVTRGKEIKSEMQFIKKMKTLYKVITHEGILNIDIYTEELIINKTMLLVRYFIDGDPKQKRELKIIIKECD